MTTIIKIITPDQMLQTGLMLIGFKPCTVQKVSRSTNLKRFRAHYGSNPIVYANIWEDLCSSNNPDVQIDHTSNGDVDISLFLMSIYFLRCYPTETCLAATFGICEKTARKWSWFFAGKIQALKTEKVSRPGNAAVV